MRGRETSRRARNNASGVSPHTQTGHGPSHITGSIIPDGTTRENDAPVTNTKKHCGNDVRMETDQQSARKETLSASQTYTPTQKTVADTKMKAKTDAPQRLSQSGDNYLPSVNESRVPESDLSRPSLAWTGVPLRSEVSRGAPKAQIVEPTEPPRQPSVPQQPANKRGSRALWLMRSCNFSLRCWIVTPLLVTFIVITVVAVTVGQLSARATSRSAFRSFHEIVVANLQISIGRVSIQKLVRMTTATGGMYFTDPDVPSPKDRLMPLENGMMSHLCGILREMDPEHVVSSLGAVSITRQQAAVCAAIQDEPGKYFGSSSKDGHLQLFRYIDPITLEDEQPLRIYPVMNEPRPISVFSARQHFDTVVNLWNKTIETGGKMNLTQYWVSPRFPPTRAAFVYPFIESYDDNTTGIGYLYATIFLRRLRSMDLYDSETTGIRVMLLDVNATAESIQVIGNNWHQPLDNVSNVWTSAMRGDPIEYLFVDTITDPIMLEAVKHVSLRTAIESRKATTVRFEYGGFDGLVTAAYHVTESGFEVVFVAVSTRSFYIGPILRYNDVTIGIEVVITVVVTAACVLFTECCLIRPLRCASAYLKKLRLGLPVSVARLPRAVVLREVRELSEQCDKLRRSLDALRPFLPDRLFLEDDLSIVEEGSTSDQNMFCKSWTDDLQPVQCSVVYVYFTPKVALNPSNEMVEGIMSAVVSAAAEFGGCIEVQRPDFCVISFGAHAVVKGDASQEALTAVRFSQQLRAELTTNQSLAGQYHILSESGSFLSGVISAQERGHFVLLCRNLHEKIGGFLPHAGVTAAVTAETEALVRGKFRLVPFETVHLSPSGTECVTLYELLAGSPSGAAWRDFDGFHRAAYGCMERGDYAAALRWLGEAAAAASRLRGETAERRSSQTERLRGECLVRSSARDTIPYEHWPRRGGAEVWSLSASLTGGSSERRAGDEGSARSSRTGRSAAAHTPTEARSDPTAHGAPPRRFTDGAGTVWRRAAAAMSRRAAAAPAYLGISATGTLAVLKVRPLTDAGGRAPRGAVDAALERLVGVEQNDSLVPYLSFCHAAPHGVVLVTEYVPGGTLRETTARYGRRLPLPAVRRNVVSILRGLSDLHGRGLVHGRVCPENVMMGVEGRCRLKGMLLGAAPLLVHHDSYYASPEEAAGGAKTAAGDMYALGLLLLEMLTNRPPWQWASAQEAEQSAKVLDALLADGVRFREALRDGRIVPLAPPDDTDEAMRGVIEACLRTAPRSRATAAFLMENVHMCAPQQSE